MYGCELLFTLEAAGKIRDQVEKHYGLCPCKAGRPCPLLPESLAPMVAAVDTPTTIHHDLPNAS